MEEDNKRKIEACIDHDIKNLGFQRFQEFQHKESQYELTKLITKRFMELRRAYHSCLYFS